MYSPNDHAPHPKHKLVGALGEGGIDPTAWHIASTTAGDESAPSLPPSTALARLTCSRLYNMLVACHYALPTAFAKDSTWCAQSHQPKDGRWRELLEATTDTERAIELKSILRDMRTSA